VGAWIEIRKTDRNFQKTASLPVWERGLKYWEVTGVEETEVAPRVGAWIEIDKSSGSVGWD